MKVNVKGIWYDAEEEPIAIELSESDKENIANMDKEAIKYICYPESLSWEEVKDKLGIKEKCYKTNEDCEHNCGGLCKESM